MNFVLLLPFVLPRFNRLLKTFDRANYVGQIKIELRRVLSVAILCAVELAAPHVAAGSSTRLVACSFYFGLFTKR